jgi:hypothetical protein
MRKAMKTNRKQPLFEILESRQLMTAIVWTGTSGADVFKLEYLNPGDTLTIDGKGGADVVQLGALGGTMQYIQGHVVINNTDGLISVLMKDVNNPASRQISIDANQVIGLAPGIISYNGAKATLMDGSGDNVFGISSTWTDWEIAGGIGDEVFYINGHKAGNLKIFGNGGHDEFRLAYSTGNLDDISAPIYISDADPGDVSIFDNEAAMGHSYWLTTFSEPGTNYSMKIDRSGPTSQIVLDGVGRVSLLTSNHDDIVYMGSATAKFPQVEVNTGYGDDTVLADNGVADSITGGIGNDTVTVDFLDGAYGFETVKAAATAGSVFGSIFADNNNNGLREAGEPGMPSFQVYLDANNDKMWNSGEAGTLTDANGNWSFIGVPSGKEFIARLQLKPGLVQTLPGNGYGLHVTLAAGQTLTGEQFGVSEGAPGNASVSGSVFNDLNSNGIKDANETFLAGRTVYVDLDNDKILDANETFTTTNAAGYFALMGLTVGTYKIRQVLPAGWAQTTPANGYGISVTLAANQSVGGKLFGARQIAPPAGASIAGTVFYDFNGNSVKDAGEGGLAGRTLWIDLDNDKILDAGEKSTVTDANGNFKFTGLAAGTYKVRQQLPSGWGQTTPLNGYGISVTVASNQSVTGKLFGEAPTL